MWMTEWADGHHLSIGHNCAAIWPKTTEDGMARLQSRFQKFYAKVNQIWTTDRQTALQSGQKPVWICLGNNSHFSWTSFKLVLIQ